MANQLSTEKVKKKLGLSDFTTLSNRDFAKITECYSKISPDCISEILNSITSFEENYILVLDDYSVFFRYHNTDNNKELSESAEKIISYCRSIIQNKTLDLTSRIELMCKLDELKELKMRANINNSCMLRMFVAYFDLLDKALSCTKKLLIKE